ncbi:alpha/beta hydrolase, partial [Clostridia bacterium OttesenSCG-928-F22]|nr:alpha/beta hydrolase [Clostridia bacterium OttesenSCG-928-F22]
IKQEVLDALAENMAGDAVQISQGAYNAVLNEPLADFDFRPHYPNINIPTLVLSGKYDIINPPEYGKEVADMLPNATFILFEKSGHMIQHEESKKYRKAIKQFLKNN